MVFFDILTSFLPQLFLLQGFQHSEEGVIHFRCLYFGIGSPSQDQREGISCLGFSLSTSSSSQVVVAFFDVAKLIFFVEASRRGSASLHTGRSKGGWSGPRTLLRFEASQLSEVIAVSTAHLTRQHQKLQPSSIFVSYLVVNFQLPPL